MKSSGDSQEEHPPWLQPLDQLGTAGSRGQGSEASPFHEAHPLSQTPGPLQGPGFRLGGNQDQSRCTGAFGHARSIGAGALGICPGPGWFPGGANCYKAPVMLSRPKSPFSFPWLSALLGVGLALGLQQGGQSDPVIAAEPAALGLPVPLELSGRGALPGATAEAGPGAARVLEDALLGTQAPLTGSALRAPLQFSPLEAASETQPSSLPGAR